MAMYADITKEGILFKWHSKLRLWCSVGQKREVLVIPPRRKGAKWVSMVPSLGRKWFWCGSDPQDQAFSSAVGLTRT